MLEKWKGEEKEAQTANPEQVLSELYKSTWNKQREHNLRKKWIAIFFLSSQFVILVATRSVAPNTVLKGKDFSLRNIYIWKKQNWQLSIA
jgi:hypothetical protein